VIYNFLSLAAANSFTLVFTKKSPVFKSASAVASATTMLRRRSPIFVVGLSMPSAAFSKIKRLQISITKHYFTFSHRIFR